MAIVGKEVVTAARYGRQDELDAFLVAFVLPAFVGSLMSNAMNSSVLPVYIRLERDRRPGKNGNALRDFLSGISFLNLVAVALVTLLVFALGLLFLPRIASGFSPDKISMTIELLILLIPYVFLSGIASLWSALLNAQERFAVVLLTPVISPLLIVILLLAFPSGGIIVLVDGVVAGMLIETVVLGVALGAGGISLRPRWRGWTAPVREAVRQFLPAAAGGCLMGSTLIVDQSMAAMLPAGSVAALSYGNKAIGFLLALLTTALVTFLTPYFSKRMGNGEERSREGSGASMTRGGVVAGQEGSGLYGLLGIAFLLGLVCAAAIAWYSEPLVRLVFYRGVFTLSDVRLVAGVQVQLAWQIPFYICAVILTRYIAAMRWNRIIFIVAACNVATNILLNSLLMRTMGVRGIALSTSLVHALSLSLLLFFIYLSKRRVS